jgi:hypothetical protein
VADAVPFQFDHIIAKQHGGRTTLRNLAFSCASCNGRKGTNIAGIGPASRRITRLFHPREDRWEEHFRWSGPLLVGKTPQGRATVRLLRINDLINLRLRESLMQEGFYE